MKRLEAIAARVDAAVGPYEKCGARIEWTNHHNGDDEVGSCELVVRHAGSHNLCPSVEGRRSLSLYADTDVPWLLERVWELEAVARQIGPWRSSHKFSYCDFCGVQWDEMAEPRPVHDADCAFFMALRNLESE